MKILILGLLFKLQYNFCPISFKEVFICRWSLRQFWKINTPNRPLIILSRNKEETFEARKCVGLLNCILNNYPKYNAKVFPFIRYNNLYFKKITLQGVQEIKRQQADVKKLRRNTKLMTLSLCKQISHRMTSVFGCYD